MYIILLLKSYGSQMTQMQLLIISKFIYKFK